MPRRYKQGADGQPHPASMESSPKNFQSRHHALYGGNRFETVRVRIGGHAGGTPAEGYDYKDGNLVPAGKEETMQEKVANTTPAAPLKLDVSVRVIEPVKI